MMYARVDGNITATRKHKSLTGWRLLICQPLDAKGDAAGAPTVAIDPYGAGLHERVIVSTDGQASRRMVGDPSSPVRNMIIGIVDPSSYSKEKK
jgi:microcompartment protein CcmK/EutM